MQSHSKQMHFKESVLLIKHFLFVLKFTKGSISQQFFDAPLLLILNISCTLILIVPSLLRHKAFYIGYVVYWNSCCVFSSTSGCLACCLLVEIISFSILKSFSITNGKKGWMHKGSSLIFLVLHLLVVRVIVDPIINQTSWKNWLESKSSHENITNTMECNQPWWLSSLARQRARGGIRTVVSRWHFLWSRRSTKLATMAGL